MQAAIRTEWLPLLILFNPLIPLTMFNLQNEIKRIKAEKRQAQTNGIILGLGIICAAYCASIFLITFLTLNP